MTESRLGAYGFRLLYPNWGDASEYLVALGETAPSVSIDVRLACPAVDQEVVDKERVVWAGRKANGFEIIRSPLSITFDFPGRVPAGALIHPLATAPFAILARWRGDVTLHAGAFVAADGAWIVAGRRHAGKSTLLALLGQRGHPVVADDLVTIDEGSVWAGPQCVDLRPDVADRFNGARNLGVLGHRPRFRLMTPSAPARSELRGMFLLDWHSESSVEIAPLSFEERLRWLYQLEYVGLLGPADPQKLLEVVARPAWRVRRPGDWAATEEASERMLELTRPIPAGSG